MASPLRPARQCGSARLSTEPQSPEFWSLQQRNGLCNSQSHAQFQEYVFDANRSANKDASLGLCRWLRPLFHVRGRGHCDVPRGNDGQHRVLLRVELPRLFCHSPRDIRTTLTSRLPRYDGPHRCAQSRDHSLVISTEIRAALCRSFRCWGAAELAHRVDCLWIPIRANGAARRRYDSQRLGDPRAQSPQHRSNARSTCLASPGNPIGFVHEGPLPDESGALSFMSCPQRPCLFANETQLGAMATNPLLRLLRFLPLAALGVALAGGSARASQSAPTVEAPFLWKVDGATAPSYLFGTIHAGVSAGELPVRVGAAIAQSDLFIMETAPAKAMQSTKRPQPMDLDLAQHAHRSGSRILTLETLQFQLDLLSKLGSQEEIAARRSIRFIRNCLHRRCLSNGRLECARFRNRPRRASDARNLARLAKPSLDRETRTCAWARRRICRRRCWAHGWARRALGSA